MMLQMYKKTKKFVKEIIKSLVVIL